MSDGVVGTLIVVGIVWRYTVRFEKDDSFDTEKMVAGELKRVVNP